MRICWNIEWKQAVDRLLSDGHGFYLTSASQPAAYKLYASNNNWVRFAKLWSARP